ncbi:hypothetical protein AC579_4555 [Pseudocercospora musae]|uniref:Fe2OG dioxygenase domain-containing protein n=1 Tax=Pseudocercospora musae TaxID=113226 RepID=A0A139ITK2_9PEZI|nr:hypothetical protein AC579_4555 [Pseudocercospora musae]
MGGLEHRSDQDLFKISLTAIISKDQRAIDKLVEAACKDGCFYLDISDLPDLFDVSDQIAQVADDFFGLPLEEKLCYEMDKFTNLHMGGYKAVGKHSGVKQGKRDAFENFLVPLSAVLDLEENLMPWPAAIERHLHLLTWFKIECHRICQQILTALSSALDKNDTPFEESHRLQERSTTALAMLKYPPTSAVQADNSGHMAHTDVGSLTLLFTKSPGLEAYRESISSWAAVPPQPGFVIVNIGDALSFMSGRRFPSCLHRVVPITAATRFSLAYFHRPELAAKFRDGQGRDWTGESWHRAKYQLFRADNQAQASSSLLTGRVNFLGHLDERRESRIIA